MTPNDFKIILVDDDPATYWRIHAELDHANLLDHCTFKLCLVPAEAGNDGAEAIVARAKGFNLIFVDLLLQDRLHLKMSSRAESANLTGTLYGLEIVKQLLDDIKMSPPVGGHPCVCVLSAYAGLPNVIREIISYDRFFVSFDEMLQSFTSEHTIKRVIYADKSERTFEGLCSLIPQLSTGKATVAFPFDSGWR